MATDQTTPTERVPSNTEVEQFTSNISTMNLAVLKDFQELFCAMLEYLKISPINNDTKASLQSCINYVKQQRPDADQEQPSLEHQITQINTTQIQFNNIAKKIKAMTEATWTLNTGQSTADMKKNFCTEEDLAWQRYKTAWQNTRHVIQDKNFVMCWTIT